MEDVQMKMDDGREITICGDKTFYMIDENGEKKIRPNMPYINEATLENLTVKTSDRFFIEKGKNIKEEVNKWISESEAEELKAEKVPYNKDHVIPHPFKKKFLGIVISEVFKHFKLSETSKTLDKMKDLGFKYSTVSGITVSVDDIKVIDTKQARLEDADKQVKEFERMYRRGLITKDELKKLKIDLWGKTKDKIKDDIKKDVDKHYTHNHIYLMSDSGARGSVDNFVQLSGIRGLMAKPNGESMDIPIRSSFREGLSMSEFFISSHGSRKGSTDTALKTAESGYLTRRLVDVSHDVTITMDDCKTNKGMVVKKLVQDDGTVVVNLKDRIRGRYTYKPVYSPNGELICGANEFIDADKADYIEKCGVEEVGVRTLLTCDCPNGVCVKCYGSDLTTGEVVEKGEVVGIIAAQSIGEPGTQLTMRTFHSGGVAGGEDITQGLPRVQELFEARPPKGKAIISEISGKISNIRPEKDNRTEIEVYNAYTGETKSYITDAGKTAIVKKDDEVKAGDKLTAGLVHPKELLRVATVDDVEKYILFEVQKVYTSQGVDICDKHIEIIIKQMLQKVLVIDQGDTDLLPGSYISRSEIVKTFEKCLREGKRRPIIKPVLLGITRSSLKSDSFLSAASFQETTRVLTESAIRGKKDSLDGLKENIIIGGLIPAGTGLVDVDELEANLSKYDVVKAISEE